MKKPLVFLGVFPCSGAADRTCDISLMYQTRTAATDLIPAVRAALDGGAFMSPGVPAAKGEFIPMLRLYWLKESAPWILDGTWKPPAVKIVGK